MSGPMGRFTYNSDSGGTFIVRGNAAQAALAGGVAAAGLANYPRRWRTRKALVRDAVSGRVHRITVYDPANALWTESSGTVSLATLGSATPTVFTVMGRIGERRPA